MCNMNSKIVIALSLCLICGICLNKSRKKQQYIDKLRDEISEEVNKGIDSTKPLLLDNLCQLIEEPNKRYIYSILQALLADRRFTWFLIMQEFEKNQVLCSLMQKIARKMISNDTVCLRSELIEMSELKIFKKHFKYSDTNFFQFVDLLTGHINLECGNHENIIGLPYKLNFDFQNEFKCAHCESDNYFGSNFKYLENVIFDNLQEEINHSYNNMKKTVKERLLVCKNCNTLTNDSSVNTVVVTPRNFMIYNDANRRREGNRLITIAAARFDQYLRVGNDDFEIYAIVCIYGCNDKKNLYSNTFAIKGNQWYDFVDDEIFQKDFSDINSIFNSDCIYFYRKK